MIASQLRNSSHRILTAPISQPRLRLRQPSWRIDHLRSVIWVVLIFIMAAAPSPAQVISASSDVTISLQAGLVVEDQDILVDNLGGILLQESLGGPIAANAGLSVVGYAEEGGLQRLFVPSTWVALTGVVAGPHNVVRFDGATYQVVFDAFAEGLPDGTRIDAVTRGKDGELHLSFDSFVDLGVFTAADEDLVRFDGTTFSVVFDGSDQGVAAGLDLDAASVGPDGRLLLSFDTSGSIDGIPFDDEDVLEFDPETLIWTPSLAFDGSVDASGDPSRWRVADLDAIQVPEPEPKVGLIAGTLLLWIALSVLRSPRSNGA